MPNRQLKTDTGYKGHRAGSRKEVVHRRFDEKGPEAARRAAISRGLEESTVATWFSTWNQFSRRKRKGRGTRH